MRPKNVAFFAPCPDFRGNGSSKQILLNDPQNISWKFKGECSKTVGSDRFSSSMQYNYTFKQGRIFIISLGGGGCGQIMGGLISSLKTGSLGDASRRLTRMNFSLT